MTWKSITVAEMDELDYSAKTNPKMANSGPWLHAWYDPLAGEDTECSNFERKLTAPERTWEVASAASAFERLTAALLIISHCWFALSGLKTVTGCVKLADLNGDGDSKLCICDFDKKLKVYKGERGTKRICSK